MKTTFTADVVVVGAGTTGCYYAWKLAESGVNVLVLEKRALHELGQHIGIFHMDEMRFAEFGIPLPQGDEVAHYETHGYSWSPDRTICQKIVYPFYVLYKPLFQQRMHACVRAAGGKIVEKALVSDVILEDGTLHGVRGFLDDGGAFEARASLVVDASGVKGTLRTRLPDGFGVENDPILDSQRLFVCLEYREVPKNAGYPTGSNSYIVYKAFWNLGPGEEVILGIGQPGSYENAWNVHRKWRQEYFGDPGRILRQTQGSVPFRRPPYSLVGNGFLVMGDAAFQNKPFSGEGVTSGFSAARIAAGVTLRALQQGDVSRDNLWEYNTRYFRGQGARFAAGLAQLPAAAELTPADLNYLFQHDIIFSSQDFEELNRDYEIHMDTRKLLRMGGILGWGTLTGRFSAASLGRLLDASSRAGRMKAHYLKFPATPADFDAWVKRARQLWGEA